MKECASVLGDMLDKILKQTRPLATKRTKLKLKEKKKIYMLASTLSERNDFISFKTSITDEF